MTRPIPTQRFAPIGLDELVSRAGLMTRVDRKYLMPIESAADVVAELDADAQVLEIDGRRDFAYESVYFDTEDDLAYRLTAHRHRRRFKVRTRSYLDTGSCYLEVKTKSGRGATVKQRVEYASEHSRTLTPDALDFTRRVLDVQGHGDRLVERFVPRLVSRYHRATLLLPEGSRATIDTRLQWSDLSAAPRRTDASVHPPARTATLPTHAIVETKSVRGASELDRKLWRAGHRPSGISKFGTGTAALRPDLPSNKWARQLRAPFDIDHQ